MNQPEQVGQPAPESVMPPESNELAAPQPESEQEQTHEIEAGPDPPMIYVASLSDYNAGTLHGVWIDATQDIETIDTEIWTMLNRSQEPEAEEVAIHDYSGFGAWRPDEYERLDTISTVARAITEHGEAITHWIDYLGEEPGRALVSFEEGYRGSWSSLNAYAEDLANEAGVAVSVDPPSWEPYVKVDFDALARDLEMDLHCSEGSDGMMHVFDPSVGW